MLHHEAAADLDFVPEGEPPVVRDVDGDGILLDHVSRVRPHDDRTARSEASADDLEVAPAASRCGRTSSTAS
jgi:hypothetical protein